MAVALALPENSFAQSEEDLLNSIGSELQSEQEKKEALEKKEKEYDGIKSKADGYLKAKKYDKAKEAYEQMLKIFPDREYAQRQIQLADQMYEQEMAAQKQQQYDEAIANADGLLSGEKFDEAKKAYQEAAKILPDEAYPKGKIQEVDKLIAEREAARKAAEVQKQYDEKIAAADNALNSKKWDEATNLYKAALAIKSDEAYPKDQIAQVAKLKAEEAERAQQAALDEKYQSIIDQAEKEFSAKNWDAATERYKAASNVKPDEAYPKDKIAEVAKLKTEEAERAEQAALDKKYQVIIDEADGLLKAEKWDEAVAKYEAASKVKPGESYPKDQIAEANRLKSDAAAAAEAAKVQAKYDALIKEADALFKSESWDEAIAKYREAATAKSDETYPNDQITQAEKLKADAAAAAEAAEVQAKYDGLIREADDLLKSEKWDEAIAKYREAAGVKPSETYPNDQITQAEKLKTDANAAAAAAEVQAKYDGIVKTADELFKAKKWDEAIAKYNEASGVKPDEAYPKDKIAEAEKSKSDAAAAEVQAEYDGIVKAADELFKAESWDEAIVKYREAAGVKSDETYPNDQIAKAEKLKADAVAAEARQRQQEQYDGYVSEGDKLFNAERYDEAIAQYQEAQKVLPNESYPGEQITKANEAQKAKADATAAAEQLEANFKAAVDEGDAAVAAKEWQNAINAYERALALKKDEAALKDKIKAAETALKEDEANQKAAEKAAAENAKLQEEYNELIAEADVALASQDYTNAISIYKKAAGVLPEETYPNEKIAEAEAAIQADADAAEQAKRAEAEAQAALEAEFEDLMNKGDEAIAAANWDAAVNAFNAAAALKPEAKSPGKKLEEVESLRSKAADAERIEAEKAAKAEALELEYQNLVQQGDDAIQAGEFVEAKGFYKNALELKPDESYPQTQIEKADQLMAEAEAAEAEAAEAERAKLEELEEEYSSIMSAAENLVQSKDYNAAIAKFNEAQALKPEAMGPKERIDHVNRLIRKEEEEQRREKEAELAAQKLEEGFQKAIDEGDGAVATNDWAAAKNAYKRAQQMKLDSPIPQEKLDEVARLEAEWLAAEEERKAAEEAERKAREEAQRKKDEKQRQYDESVAEGDRYLAAGQLDAAATAYVKAKETLPDMEYPQSKLAEIETLRAEKAAELERQKELEAKRRAAEEEARKQAEAFRKEKEAKAQKERAERARKAREERIRRYKELQPEALAKKYGEGYHVDTYVDEEKGRTVTTTVIVENGMGRQLVMYEYPWGAKFYFYNGKQITGDAYNWDQRAYK